MKHIPTHIVHVQYSGEELQKKGPVTAASKFLYVYTDDNLDEVMMKAWRSECTATVYSIIVKSAKKYKPSKVVGIWQ